MRLQGKAQPSGGQEHSSMEHVVQEWWLALNGSYTKSASSSPSSILACTMCPLLFPPPPPPRRAC